MQFTFFQQQQLNLQKMNNHYEEYDYMQFQQDDGKCIHNTAHTTGNAYQRFESEDPYHPNYLLSVQNRREEGLIHFSEENNYLDELDINHEAIDLLEDEEEERNHIESVKGYSSLNQNIEEAQSQKQSKIDDKQLQIKEKQVIEENQKSSLFAQLSPDYKLSKKWKQKLKGIVQQKCINQFSAKHNRNMAKFFIRVFSKYIKLNDQTFQFPQQLAERLQQIAQKKCISLKDLQTIFGGENSRSCRQFLAVILRTRLKQEVIKSHDVLNKMAYLLCSKVYALRCRSRHLIGRLQSR